MSAMFEAFLALQFAVGMSAATLFLVSRCLPSLNARNLLGLNYAAASLVIVMALLAPWMPSDLLRAPVLLQAVIAGDEGGFLADLAQTSLEVAATTWLPGLSTLGNWLAASCVAIGACVVILWCADAWRLRRLRQRAQLVRRHGRVRLWISDDAHSPFSFRGMRHVHVFIPQFVVARQDWYRLALAHELQHHRQGDTAWLYLFGLLRVLCGANPFTWWWVAAVARWQELACDEALLERQRWSATDYARGLLDVAQAAAPHRGAAWAPSLTGKRHSLKRRIEHMMEQKRTPPGAPVRVALYVGLLAVLTATTVAASSLSGNTKARAAQGESRTAGALPIRIGAVAATFEIPEEGASKRSHAGVDIAAPAGTRVYAWQDGVVVQAGPRKGCGQAVVLQHWQGTRSLYCNLAKLRVTAGESVGREQTLGELADPGANKKAHLHFEIEVDGRNVDPAGQVNLMALK